MACAPRELIGLGGLMCVAAKALSGTVRWYGSRSQQASSQQPGEGGVPIGEE
jgi:hypothetical protein